MRRLLLLVLAALAIAACNRIVDLTPAADARPPDGARGDGGPDGGSGNDGGIGDAGIGDGGGALPDAFVPDA